MRNCCWKSLLGLTLAVSLALAPVAVQAGSLEFRTPGLSGDTSSDGAVITVALFATVCVVLVLLGLKADYENVFTRADHSQQSVAAPESDPEIIREISRKLDLSSNPARNGAAADPLNVGVAWHVRF